LKEASARFHELLKKKLIEAGFVASVNDPSLFVKVMKDGSRQYVVTHVDDLMLIGKREHNQTLKAYLKSCFKKVEVDNKVSGFDYLGLVGRLSADGSIGLSQPGYIDKIANEFGFTFSDCLGSELPYDSHLFESSTDDNEIYEENSFRSRLMMVAYMVKTRPDIKLAIAYLTTRMHCPTFEDHLKLVKVVRYLIATKDLEMMIWPSNMVLHCSADASFGIHADRKSHSGMVLTLGAGSSPIHVSSRKQKLVSTSSTEAELIALSEATKEVVWTRNILNDLGFPQILPTTIEQDNTSAITLAENGSKAKGRSRSVDIKFFWVKEKIDQGDVALVHVGTDELVADGLTKPIMGAKFKMWRDAILGVRSY
jgi:hypothetical protein